jgi:hypothetical protein
MKVKRLMLMSSNLEPRCICEHVCEFTADEVNQYVSMVYKFMRRSAFLSLLSLQKSTKLFF